MSAGEWGVRSEDGTTAYSSEEVAKRAVKESGWTLGIDRSPIIAALWRRDRADEWQEWQPEDTAPVSRVQAVEAAEDRAEQVAFDSWRERGL